MQKNIQSLLTWMLSSLLFTLFIVPVLLAIISALKIDTRLFFTTFVKMVSNITMKRPPGFKATYLNSQSGLNSSILHEFHYENSALEFRLHYYDINDQSFREFRKHLKDKSRIWRTDVNNSNYLVQTAPFYYNHSDAQRVSYATRCRLHLSTQKTADDILNLLASPRHVSLFLPVKHRQVHPPIYGFEWYNGSMEVHHIALSGLRIDFRMELIALKSIDNSSKTIIYRSIEPSEDDIQYIEASSRNFRNESITITPHNIAKNFIGITIVPQKRSKSQDVSRDYHIKLFRYATDLQQVPWIDWMTNTFLFCPALHSKLKNLLNTAD